MSTPNNLQSLFATAQEEGSLTQAAAAVINIPDMGEQIQAGLGVSVDDVQASEVTLVSMLLDDSGSIEICGNTDNMMNGHNLFLDTFNGSKQGQDTIVHARSLNNVIYYPFCTLQNAIRLNRGNYQADKGTPLYDATAVMLGTVLAKTLEFEQACIPCRTITVIVTDGNDEHSKIYRRKPEALRPLIEERLKREMHVVAAMGIDDGSTNFRKIFGAMGIPDQWILTPKNSPGEIRKAFALVSQSALRVSQAGAGSFSQAAAGGFGG